jgi:hypothetical protein
MKLSPPTTKTQKPQRYLTLLYRHLGYGLGYNILKKGYVWGLLFRHATFHAKVE